jgi:Bacterial transglutaminase-like cysteine proteinase BTLCP
MERKGQTDWNIVIAEIVRGLYELGGKYISQPSNKRHPCFKGRPMGLFLSQPVKVVCRDIDEIRAFLSTCRYVSDQEQFGVKDHWMAPEEFEQTRRGDCDDFALWTWRQLLGLGYNARFVVGSAGRYGTGHAWVTFGVGDKAFLVEALLARAGRKFPRLSILRYRPIVSVEISGTRIRFFEHSRRPLDPPLLVLAPLVPEWLLFRLRTLPRVLIWPFLSLARWLRRKCTRHSQPRHHSTDIS